MSVTLLDVWRAARARAVPFAGESAGYLVVLLCEELDRLPRHVTLDGVVLDEHGAVHVRSPEGTTPVEAERELRDVLGRLLDVASSPGPALLRAASRPPTGNVTALAYELQKALVPLNRTAAQRALLRLYRETQRARHEGRLSSDVPAAGPSPHHRNEAQAEPSRAAAASQGDACSPSPPDARGVRPAREAAHRREVHEAPRESEQTPPMGTLWISDADPLQRGHRAHAVAEVPRQERSGARPVSPYPDPPARRSDIEELLRGFAVVEGPTREEVCIELKRLAGVEGTPDPGNVAERKRGGTRGDAS